MNFILEMTVTQLAMTVILISLCQIGFIRQLYLIARIWIYDTKLVNNYCKKAAEYIEGIAKGSDNNLQAQYIVRKTNSLYEIFGEERVDLPEIDLQSSIRYDNIHTLKEYDNIIRRLAVTSLEWDEKRKNKRWILLIQLFVPLFFWLFRGVESIIILFVYLLHELGIKSIKTKGGFVRVCSIIFTIITGLASLFSYFNVNLFN